MAPMQQKPHRRALSIPAKTYRDYISFRQRESACISKLTLFLTPPRPPPPHSFLFWAAEVRPDTNVEFQPLDQDKLHSAVTLIPKTAGRIIIIEDLHPSALDILGSCLDIDPVFFADYVVTDLEDPDTSSAPPSVALTPSQILSQGDCFHIHYQQIVDLSSNDLLDSLPWVMKTWTNVPRSVRRLPRYSNERQFGIVRGCCSILTRHLGDSWIAIILVDSTTSPVVSDPKNPGTLLHRSYLDSGVNLAPKRPSFTEFQAAISPPPPHSSASSSSSSLKHSPSPPPSFQPQGSLLEQIKSHIVSSLHGQHWTRPTALDIALAGPLRPITGEWMLYSQIVANILKRSEFSFAQGATSSFSESEIIGLQKWRHRIIQSQHKLTATKDYIEHHHHHHHSPTSDSDPPGGTRSLLIIKDITHLLDKLDRYLGAFNRIIPIAPALVQVHDHRRAVAEQVFVRRLTYIAFVFVPASWVAAIFSMASEYGPGQPKFWVYFAVSVPFCLAIVIGSLLLSSVSNVARTGGSVRNVGK
ncbi:hypothetical protein QBC43DRAFT_326921 [Cladorrhinum sp. PSN259]|nr:hypothetical protein QBC43DRAFT_326921 [Cladorrhinum sp. PSN259]